MTLQSALSTFKVFQQTYWHISHLQLGDEELASGD
jgi:hypothetical protein